MTELTGNPVYDAQMKRAEALEALVKSKPPEFWEQYGEYMEKTYENAYEQMGLPYYKYTTVDTKTVATIVYPKPKEEVPPTLPAAGAGALLLLALLLLWK